MLTLILPILFAWQWRPEIKEKPSFDLSDYKKLMEIGDKVTIYHSKDEPKKIIFYKWFDKKKNIGDPLIFTEEEFDMELLIERLHVRRVGFLCLH